VSFAATVVPPIILADQDSAQAALLATYNTIRSGKFDWVAGGFVTDMSVRPIFADEVNCFNGVLTLSRAAVITAIPRTSEIGTYSGITEIITQWYLPEQILKVKILTGYPNHPVGKIFAGYQQRWSHREADGPTQGHRVPLCSIHNTIGVKRAGMLTVDKGVTKIIQPCRVFEGAHMSCDLQGMSRSFRCGRRGTRRCRSVLEWFRSGSGWAASVVSYGNDSIVTRRGSS
jgi:hypothetical protein